MTMKGDAQEKRGARPDPFRWVIEHPAVVDAVVWGTVTLLLTLFTLFIGAVGWWLPFTLPMVAAGAICRTRPGWGVAVIGSLAVIHVAAGLMVVLGDVMTFYAMFCAVAYGSTRIHVAGIIAGIAGVITQTLSWTATTIASPYASAMEAFGVFVTLLVTGTISIVAVWALANLQRARVRQLALQRERAEQAVREREQRTALAVAEERARIAREMHDVVAHSLSVIIAQADGGRFIASQHPEKAADVLRTIGDTGRAALADMRSLLGVLRQDEHTTFGPQPGPSALPELIERVRAAGLPVQLELSEDLDDIPQALGMSLFRLVQEALTNVMKHAGEGARASVTIRRTAQTVEAEIIDDGRGTDPDSDGMGHGITGMRERVSVYGGELTAGPLPGRGFRVMATLPLQRTAPREHDRTDPHSPSRQFDPASPSADTTHLKEGALS